MLKISGYNIISILGSGAFGNTYKAEHAILKVSACVKQEKTGKKQFLKWFREEAVIISLLRHPSLPAFINYLEKEPPVGHVLLMSFIEGEPLDKKVETEAKDKIVVAQNPIDDEHICWIMDRLLGALSYLHGKWRIIHCDLKPGNVILDIPDHNATIVDFGMATRSPVEWTKSKGGTPGFLPPEFGTGLPPIPASDIYSAGKIACFIAGGNVANGEFPEDMNEDLRIFFEQWIRHDPMQRPQSADALRHDLLKLREKIFRRTTCLEEFKFRNHNPKPKKGQNK